MLNRGISLENSEASSRNVFKDNFSMRFSRFDVVEPATSSFRENHSDSMSHLLNHGELNKSKVLFGNQFSLITDSAGLTCPTYLSFSSWLLESSYLCSAADS